MSFESVCENFLGNNRDPKSKTIVSHMSSKYKDLGCLMSLKIHFLFSHLDYVSENVEAFSEEMGKRFHQDFNQKATLSKYRWD